MKTEYQDKGTLIIKGLLRNLVLQIVIFVCDLTLWPLPRTLNAGTLYEK